MVRGNTELTKMHYKGKEDDFVVFVESPEAVQEWKKDSSKPLVDVVNSFKVFLTHKHGAQGELDGASKQMLENEFGTSNDDECIKKILELGTLQSTENPGRGGQRNDTIGAAGVGKQTHF